MSLSDLDNTVQSITGSTTSLFDYEFNLVKSSCAYYISYNDKTDMNEEILVEYEILNDNEDTSEIIVRIDNVSKL